LADALEHLLDGAIEEIEKASAGTWGDARVRSEERWSSEESFKAWQARVSVKARKLADGFKKLTDESKPIREYSQEGALKR
jgi:hypothetical protein